jgi:hypothetical protein
MRRTVLKVYAHERKRGMLSNASIPLLSAVEYFQIAILGDAMTPTIAMPAVSTPARNFCDAACLLGVL